MKGLIEVHHGKQWCVGTITKCDYYDHSGNIKPPGSLTVNIKLDKYKLNKETKGKELKDFDIVEDLRYLLKNEEQATDSK